MFTHYLKTAIRHLTRHKTYSVINILGLAMGIAFCLLTFLFVKHEWSYDKFHKQSDHIFRLISKNKAPKTGETYFFTIMPETMAPLLKEEFPQIDQIVRIRDGFMNPVQIDQQPYDTRFLFVDPNFFQMFSFPLTHGDATTALDSPSAIVLTKSTAKKCFGSETPIGKSVTIQSHYWQNESRAFTVTGIAADPPTNSSIQFDILFPYSVLPPTRAFSAGPDSPMNDPSKLNFFILNNHIFVKLHNDSQVREVNQNLEAFVDTRKVSQRDVTIQLQPITESHFDSRPEHTLEPPGNPAYPYILMGITIAVLLIACVNFMNLAIARLSTRAREVGVRKMVGAQRGQLMRQFWGESFIVTTLALLLGFALAEFFLPTFNQLIQMPLELDYGLSTSSFLFSVGILLFIGLTSGMYPAFILSNFEPIAILKSRLQLNSSGLLRNALVVLQFTVSIFLVIGTVVMFQQISFLKGKNLGFAGDQIVAFSTSGIKVTGNSQTRRTKRNNILSAFRNQLQQHASILGVTHSRVFSNMKANKSLRQLTAEFPNDVEVQIPYLDVDTDFLTTMGIARLQGRNFEPDESLKMVLVNETLVNQFALTAPLGEQLPVSRNIARNRRHQIVRNPEIIGVIKDFHVRSLHQSVPPLILFLNPPQSGEFLVRIHPERTAETLSFMAEQWKTITGDAPFEYVFVDDQFDHQFQNEERWQAIITYASAFGLFVACLGVLGLTAIAVSRRTKEFGIRKVLGATTQHIVTLLSRELMILILIANLVAWPIAYYGVNRWLQDFAYRIDIGISLFLIGGAFVFFTALLTIALQALQAAHKNPVEALRYE